MEFNKILNGLFILAILMLTVLNVVLFDNIQKAQVVISSNQERISELNKKIKQLEYSQNSINNTLYANILP